MSFSKQNEAIANFISKVSSKCEMPKVKSKKEKKRHDPLDVDLAEADSIEVKPKLRKTGKKVKNKVDQDDNELPKTLERKILAEAERQRQEELAIQLSMKEDVEHAEQQKSSSDVDEGEDDEDLRHEEEEYDDLADEEYMDEDEAAAFEFFSRPSSLTGANRSRTLGEIIASKLAEKEHTKSAFGESGMTDQQSKYQDKLTECYKGVGEVLAHYSTGRIPRAFKILPALKNWEEIMYLTRPDLWTPPAVYQATRIFMGKLKPKDSTKFCNIVLLDHVRADIDKNKKLNFHYYMSLKKALYHPQAFFKGILFPLCQEGDCTSKEATIIGSVMTKTSIPVLHAAAAIMKLAQMSYTPSNCYFLRNLISKKYNLPARVISDVVEFFMRFLDTSSELPVLWHTTLLMFVQRYRNEVSQANKERIRSLMKRHTHYSITPEIRRELFGQAKERVGGSLETDMQMD